MLSFDCRLRFVAREQCWVAGPWVGGAPGTTVGCGGLGGYFTLYSAKWGALAGTMENVSTPLLANSISFSF